MATKTKAIEGKVDERLAEAISDKAVKAWHATKSQSMKYPPSEASRAAMP